jgi:hypothetical protein
MLDQLSGSRRWIGCPARIETKLISTDTTMSKFFLAAFAVASLLALTVPASAGYYDVWGYYHPLCYWDAFGNPLGCY